MNALQEERNASAADALELLLEVFFAEDGAVVFQALVVHREALDGEGLDDAGGPFAKLDGALGVHLVTEGDDGGEVVVRDRACTARPPSI